jgi:Kef-type K+ transport system membrane component KefB
MSNLHLFVKVAIALLMILTAARIVGSAARLIAQPRVVGEMIAGVLLGPTLLGALFPEWQQEIFPKEVMPYLFVICNIGLSFYMFLVGTEINLDMFTKKTLIDSSLLSFGAIIVPFAAGFLASWWYGDLFNSYNIPFVSFGIFLGTAFAITAFPMLARILQEKNIIGTKLGGIAMISASMQDVVSWILLGFVTAIAAGNSFKSVYWMVAGAVGLVIVLFYVIKPLLLKLLKNKTTDGFQTNTFAIVLWLLLFCAIFTDEIGLYSVFGGFMLGLAIPREGNFISEMSIRLKDIVVILFLPVFFAYSGLNTDMRQLANVEYLVPSLLMVIIAFASKYIPLYGVMRYNGYSHADGMSVAALMNSRGLMELIIANIGLFYSLIDSSVYSILVLIAVTTTLGAMPVYEFYQRKSKAFNANT